jgi:uroporphyrinogen decarboxylase
VKKNWTSRQRVIAALEHRESDRVPVDVTIHGIAYRRLRASLGLPEDNQKGDRFGEVQPAFDLLKKLGVDMTFIRLRGPSLWKAPATTEDGIEFDQWGVGQRRIEVPGAGSLLEAVRSPLANLDPGDINLEAYQWPNPRDPGRVAGLAEEARRTYEETDLAIMGRFGGTIMEQATFLRGYEQWMMDLALYPAFARDLMNRIADIQIALDEAGIREAGRYLTVLKLSGEDLGSQRSPLFSQKTWQEILRPILSRRWKAARAALDSHDASHVKLMLHSDGAIRPFLNDLIEDGVDCIDPVQVQCEGMQADGLKKDFGQKLTFHGGIDTQRLLPFGSADEVHREVQRCIRALAPGGGFILTPMHNVQPDVPAENILAMCEAARTHGRYPLG